MQAEIVLGWGCRIQSEHTHAAGGCQTNDGEGGYKCTG